MRKKIVLACTECGSRNYSYESNQSTSSERLEIKKFCSTCNSHAIHKETK
ncbi:50S ribosomal protein L33 [Peribacillus butanolivorans]|uniref:Large ribosomal subunit protein bL33 n=1 Tax=Peribacillus butanolivorans TaxID=421767 RepID=A0AAX0S7F1_9BACI|nr:MULTISPECIES: 50S ribosomal protein L33 [Peribacillus]AXN39105.1 50S ribosomal protein L33 [Peribacillus butanolivorans]MBK5444369.1 50S ribosomal protein L33 [Peribacillus sp. TH24]MBK5460926.1 50S ribosomal protein L33 [Peribacillus sp. TH27]MBK5485760.1 50S ribosomal protein L33 [Peribacillus sp. TH16]MBK5499068.1 50S ribosomal protein L33 [Peribacillus sp. TH14]